jgi:hypothetical protein
MDNDEYNKLFHTLELNLVAFKPLMQCDQEVLKLVNAAIEAEREACAVIAFNAKTYLQAADAIRARGQG